MTLRRLWHLLRCTVHVRKHSCKQARLTHKHMHEEFTEKQKAMLKLTLIGFFAINFNVLIRSRMDAHHFTVQLID